MTPSPPIPVVLCFDVEPDGIEVEAGAGVGPWRGFERALDRSGELREVLAAATGRPVWFNWFLRMDPQIAESHGHSAWVADRYGDRLEALRAAGDTVGVHPHLWRWSAPAGRLMADYADPAWLDRCVRVSFETYEAAFGEPCRAVRFGDKLVTPRAMGLVADLGARFDVSVEPETREARSIHRGVVSSGRIPGHVGAPMVPYRPSRDDPLRPSADGRNEPRDAAGLWMIPLTMIDPDPIVPLYRRIGRHVKQPRGPRWRTAALNAPWGGAGFWRIVEEGVDRRGGRHLAFALRTDVFIDPAFSQAVDDKLAALRASPLAGRLAFTTPAGVIAREPAAPGGSRDS